MELTGANKKQFEKWFIVDYKKSKSNSYYVTSGLHFVIFYKKRFEEQIGVYLAYFDSLGYKIQAVFKHRDGWRYSISYRTEEFNPYKKFEGYMKCCYNMNEAYKEAFNKANNLVNNKP